MECRHPGCVRRVHTIIGRVEYEWDNREKGKAAKNFRKHGVQLAEALPVFSDLQAVTIVDSESDPEEERFVSIGFGAKARLLVVVYAFVTEERIRVISARLAEPHEMEEYGEQP